MRSTRLVVFTVAVVVFLFSQSINVVAQGARTARVIAEKVNLRETPSALGLAEGEVSESTIVKILDEKLPWYVVRVGDRVGWMHGATLQFVSDEAVDTQSAPVRLSTTPFATPTRPRATTYPALSPAPSQTDGGSRHIRGPRGGCYYVSGSGRKVYVDRSLCN